MTLALALQALNTMLANAGTLSTLIATAQAEGRTTLTDAEWAQVTQERDAAIAKLDADIAAATGAPKP